MLVLCLKYVYEHSDFDNKILSTGRISKRHLFLTTLEDGKSKIKALADLVSGEGRKIKASHGRGRVNLWGVLEGH
jgi:hypothetical protein